MSFPRRLLVSSNHEFEREILGSASLDQPSPSALSRTARALGLSASALGTWATMAAGSAAAQTTVSALGVVAKTSVVTVLKFVTIGFVAGSVAVGTVSGVSSLVRSQGEGAGAAQAPALAVRPLVPAGRTAHKVAPDSAAAPVGSHSTPMAMPSVGLVSPAGNHPPDRVSVGSSPATEAVARPTEPASPTELAVSSGRPNAVERSALGKEVAMLDRARRALEQRDGRAALAELDRYQQAPSDHLLQTEANVIRVEALYQQGLRLEARRLATELLAHQPPGRLADRLRALVNGPTNP